LVEQLEAALTHIAELEKRLAVFEAAGEDAGQFLAAAVEGPKA
jgi:hypothetical protein